MVGRSPFGVRLWRLLSSRRPTFETSVKHMVAMLARDAGVPSSELDAVIKGAEPTPEILRQLAPVLGIRTADMFVIGGLPVPLDLASAWPTSHRDASWIVRSALRMSPEQIRRLDEVVRSLPVQPRSEPAPADDYPEGPGALMLRLLRNRNLGPYNAYILMLVGGGPYVSHSTVAGLGRGRVEITPQYVTAFAHLLGYLPQDMVALAGVGPVVEDVTVHPASVEIANLAWHARGLSSEQIEYVVKSAEGHL